MHKFTIHCGNCGKQLLAPGESVINKICPCYKRFSKAWIINKIKKALTRF